MSIITCSQTGTAALRSLLTTYGMSLELVETDRPIPGSFWGESEAGLVGSSLYVRADTPVHSALHEACHWICMDKPRRSNLHTDAGGDVAEENAVCYLQILLSDHLPGLSRERLFTDMDAWGYSFRLGSAAAWYERDADDARQWLLDQGLIDEGERLTWRVRG